MSSTTVIVSVPTRPTVQASPAVLPRVVISASAGAEGGLLPDAVATAAEPISGGDFVTFTALGLYRADANANRPAHGFVRTAVSAGAQVPVYSTGKLPFLSGLTPGTVYFLAADNPGKLSTTANGAIVQRLGVASDPTTLSVLIHQPIAQLPVMVEGPRPGAPSTEPPVFTAP